MKSPEVSAKNNLLWDLYLMYIYVLLSALFILRKLLIKLEEKDFR